jgi:glutaredoxin-like protein
LLPDDKKNQLKEVFNQLQNPVNLLVFTQELECRFCAETRQLIEELAALSDKIGVSVYDFLSDADMVKKYKIERIPAVAVIGRKDYGVRFYGIPYGYELHTLVEAIKNVSASEVILSERTREVLSDVKSPVNIKVFVTLTCPHCPEVAATAYKLAVASDFITADVIDATEFPDLSQKYAIIGVPKVVINERIEFIGPLTEELFAEHVLLGAY